MKAVNDYPMLTNPFSASADSAILDRITKERAGVSPFGRENSSPAFATVENHINERSLADGTDRYYVQIRKCHADAATITVEWLRE